MTVPTQEAPFSPANAWLILGGTALNALAIASVGVLGPQGTTEAPFWIAWVILSALLSFLTLPGYFLVNPNMSKVLVLFGKYRGTVRNAGFYWTNPFTSKVDVSLKAHNIASKTIKVNDIAGNPIEIGAVVVWRVTDTFQALFDVESYRSYVDIQIETAIRELAQAHPYDEGQAEPGVSAVSLRGDTGEVQSELLGALQQRLDRAGISVIDARISHLAYAQEIAAAMLQRQQANAMVAARERIVEGAVGMVKHALEDLAADNVVELNDDRRATLVGNLLVVLCGQAQTTPVVNAGSL